MCIRDRLSSADDVFCHSIEEVCTRLFNLVSWNVCYKIFLGGLAGMYLFWLLYSVFQPPAEEAVHLLSLIHIYMCIRDRIQAGEIGQIY